MLLSETAKILAKVQLIDNRTVDRVTVDTWHEIIGHFTYEDVLAAINLHRLESTEYLVPAHIKANMTRAKAIRKRNEAKQRAIETTRVCELIESYGEVPTAARIEEMREMLDNVGRMDRPAVIEPAPTNLYERLKASPEAQARKAS